MSKHAKRYIVKGDGDVWYALGKADSVAHQRAFGRLFALLGMEADYAAKRKTLGDKIRAEVLHEIVNKKHYPVAARATAAKVLAARDSAERSKRLHNVKGAKQ
jgi:hypothetical protein